MFVVWRYIQPAIAQDIERKRQERVKVLVKSGGEPAAINAATAALIA